MPYTPTDWVDGVTPVNATNLDKLETGVADAVAQDEVTVAGTRIVANKLLLADAQPSFQILGSGSIAWGAGGASALDTNLFRSGANVLQTDDSLVVGGTLTLGTNLAVGEMGSGTPAAGKYLDGAGTWTALPVSIPSTRTVSITTDTPVIGDANNIIELSNAGAITLTLPLNSSVAYAVGTSITIIQTGAGQVTVANGGTTLNGSPGLKLNGQWAAATLLKRATDTWILFGNITA